MGPLVRKPDVRQEQAELARFYQQQRDACLRAVLAVAGDRHAHHRPAVDVGPPTVFVIAFDDAAKIPTCINADVEPGTGP